MTKPSSCARRDASDLARSARGRTPSSALVAPFGGVEPTASFGGVAPTAVLAPFSSTGPHPACPAQVVAT
ncbi:hypothetical protein [Quadrisphaera sp. DSM 44207]|uniref:hypothetical protein n=1 Tax=Quadrisphaera sp. DSM 44207 TaxID=1881057 RepID=UPI000882486B|nr:hypothetical protein [Quadrisphaera sp. DSM 44207]SDQ72635.1 hypothetical protein SAMN05428996_2560 [Quadrisphaera sp. DSM 44207]